MYSGSKVEELLGTTCHHVRMALASFASSKLLFNWSSQPQKIPGVILIKTSMSLGTQLGGCGQPFTLLWDLQGRRQWPSERRKNGERKQRYRQRETVLVYIPDRVTVLLMRHVCTLMLWNQSSLTSIP